MTKLSKRASAALEILKAGGQFRYGLETGWQGKEQFHWRLIGHKGYGHATYHELAKAGVEFTARPLPSGFTGSATYYYLKGTE